MWDAISEGVKQLITNAGYVVGAVLGTASESGGTAGALSAIQPLFFMGAAGSVMMLGMKVLSMFSWGR